MIYCISDIHGDKKKFDTMLELINFSSSDQLYIIGDIIDRHPDGIEIIKQVIGMPNVTCLMGNHEHMMLDFMIYHCKNYENGVWRKLNGGNKTYATINYKVPVLEKYRILDWMLNLPYSMSLEVNNKKFYLTHGFPVINGKNDYDTLWERPTTVSKSPFEDCTIIVGHTPTPYLTGILDAPWSIYHNTNNDVIDIDCGCGNTSEFRRLGCLRLNDMKEFYV